MVESKTARRKAEMIIVNKKEYAWIKGMSLQSLLNELRDEFVDEEDTEVSTEWMTVAINHKLVPVGEYGSLPIADGDEITVFPIAPIAGG